MTPLEAQVHLFRMQLAKFSAQVKDFGGPTPIVTMPHGLRITKDRSTTIEAKPNGTVTGWASTDDLDFSQHRIMAGAFTESINKRGFKGPQGIKLLLDHDARRPAGVIKSLRYIGGKLWMEAQMNLDIQDVRERHSALLMMGGANFSVGFYLQDFERKQDAQKNDYLQINRGDLFEVSVVLFPANEFAQMTSVKGLASSDGKSGDSIEGSLMRINALVGALKSTMKR